MKFEVFSARLFDEEATYDKYREVLEKEAKVSYICQSDTRNPENELEIDHKHTLPS